MRNIKYLIMDVDGTLTDGKVYVGNDGELMKAFHIKDGCGIHDILIPAQIVPIIMTGRFSEIVKVRCQEIGIELIYQGVSNKFEKLQEVSDKLNCQVEYMAYIGDDINDLVCMQYIKEAGGIIGCPADAIKEVVAIADFVSSKNGGNGAVREFIEWLLYD